MPEDHFFNGHFAFVVFGPQGLSKVALSHFSADDPNVPKHGRKKAREMEVSQKNKQRENTALPDDHNRRGLALKNEAAAAHLAHREMIEKDAQSVNSILLLPQIIRIVSVS